MEANSNARIIGGASNNPTTSWAGALAGSVLFVIAGLLISLFEIPREWGWQSANTLSMALFLLLLILSPVFFAAGWINGFPAWSYPSIAYMLQWSSYATQVATPGLRIFNYTFGPNDLWGWRAWIPVLIATGIALLVTRSFNSLLKLIQDDSQDWTRYTFGMFGFFPMWALMNFDGLDQPSPIYFMLTLAFVMPATALLYLRSRSTRRRAVTLFVGISISVLIVSAARTLYWHPEGWPLIRAISMGITFLLISFLPALIAWLQKKEDSGEKVSKTA